MRKRKKSSKAKAAKAKPAKAKPAKTQPSKYLLRLLAKTAPTQPARKIERMHPSLDRTSYAPPQRETIDPITRKRTAYHEAGHAVACRRLFGIRGEVTIIPDVIEGTAGFHKTVPLPDHNIDNMEKQILYICGGYAACVAAGMPDQTARLGCGRDFEQAEVIISKWDLAPLREHLRKAVDFMRRPDNLLAVRRLGDELMIRETMDGEYVDMLLRVVDEGTCEAEAEFEIYKMNRRLI